MRLNIIENDDSTNKVIIKSHGLFTLFLLFSFITNLPQMGGCLLVWLRKWVVHFLYAFFFFSNWLSYQIFIVAEPQQIWIPHISAGTIF